MEYKYMTLILSVEDIYIRSDYKEGRKGVEIRVKVSGEKLKGMTRKKC